MSYDIKIDKKVFKFFVKLSKTDSETAKTLLKLIYDLKINPYESKKMKGKFKGLNRIKSGDYRIIFRIDKMSKVVRVLEVGKRSNIYK